MVKCQVGRDLKTIFLLSVGIILAVSVGSLKQSGRFSDVKSWIYGLNYSNEIVAYFDFSA